MNREYLLEELFNKWSSLEKIDSKIIHYTIYKSINPMFSNYDDWKLASKDDYYKEIDMSSLVDLESLYNYIKNKIDEEFSFDDLFKEYPNEKLFLSELQNEFFSTFNHLYDLWEDNFKEKLIEDNS